MDPEVVDELFIVTEPGHIQFKEAKKMSPEERDIMRATQLRERLEGMAKPQMSTVSDENPPSQDSEGAEEEKGLSGS